MEKVFLPGREALNLRLYNLISNMFKKFFKKKKGKKIVLKKDDHVRHDWGVALLIFAFATFLVVLLSFLIFQETNTVEQNEPPVLENTDLIDQGLLDETLQYYSGKEDIYLKYQNRVPIAPEL